MTSAADPVGWREERRVSFRAAILAATERLIRETNGTSFSMQTLADEADVALVTPYSLFGSKAGVLYARLNEGLRSIHEQLEALALADPLEQILAVSRVSADLYGRDPALYRPLLRFLSGTLAPELHPPILTRAMHLYRPAIQEGIRRGILLTSTRVDVLERLLLVSFTGVLQFWIQEEIDGDALRDHILYGTVLTSIPFVVHRLRPRLLKDLAKWEKALPEHLAEPSQASAGAVARIPRKRKT